MKMNLTGDAKRLRISQLVSTHNHETSQVCFNSLPKQRLSLDETQKASVQEMLALKCNKKLVKQHIVTTMEKNVTLRDIHNMKVNNSSSVEETVKYLKSLGGHVEVVLEENKLEGIFYQDCKMKEAFAANPELLLLDATYCLNNLYMPLYILMVINGNGQGQVAGLFILAHETSANIIKMLSIFRQQNVLSGATKTIFTDKDFSEREAIRQTFPTVNLLLCFFHTLKTFRSKISKLGLSNEERKKALHILQQIAYSSNEVEYEKYHTELLNLRNPKISDYFNANWHPIRYEWVRGFIKMEKTFSVTTTNHLESLNNKIKQVVSRNSNLLSFFKDLLTALDSIHGEQKSRAINMVLKHSTQNRKGSLEEFYESRLTPYAWNLVCSELEAAKTMIYCFEATASHDACGCTFFINTSLPCRHIFWKRNDAGLALTAVNLIPMRFTKEKHVSLYTTSEVHQESPTCVISSLPPPEKARILNKQDKYKKAMEVCGDIANILSDYGTDNFSSALEELHQFKTMLLKNKNIIHQRTESNCELEKGTELGTQLEESDGEEVVLMSEIETGDTEMQEELLEEIDVEVQEKLDAGQAGLEVQVESLEAIGETQLKVQEEAVLKGISIKGMSLKRRGRPRGADTTVVGLKRKRN